ncbi:MAG: hypothetical protein HYT93_04160 [Parcubacteria group bacterium]|nr:hypothetical protein [Parcubacteria group bacterium]
MFNVIVKLQRQPLYVRKQAAFFISGLIVFIIAVLWIATFGERFAPDKKGESIVTETKNDLAPFALLKEQFVDLRSLFQNKPEF